MLISDVEFYLVKFYSARGSLPIRIVLVRIQTEGGIEGWGEAPLPWRLGELSYRRDAILPNLMGKHVLDVAEILDSEKLPPRLRVALELGCLDAAGKLLGLPVCRLLGGLYRPRIPTVELTLDLADDHAIEKAQRWIDRGVTHWMVETSGDLNTDLGMVASLRDRFGAGVRLRFDARATFSLPQAIQLCRQATGEGLELLLDPLSSLQWSDYQRLREETECPLAVRVNEGGIKAVWALARYQPVEHLVLDVLRCGGLSAVRDAVAVASAAGLGVSLSVGESVGILLAGMLHLAAALPALASAQEIRHEETTSLAAQLGLRSKDALWEIPDSPGLGLDMSKEFLEQASWSSDLWSIEPP